MTRHSKNNNALGIFTQNEVVKLNQRNITQRLGRDSIQAWDGCSLCLAPLEDPLEFAQRLFCKKCLLENVINQKHMIAQRKDREAGLHGQSEAKKQQLLLEKEQDNVDAFIKQNSIAFEEKTVESKPDLTTFYIQNQSKPLPEPAYVETEDSKTNERPKLFGKAVSLKKTQKVIFSKEKNCPCCLKSFKNGMELTLLSCGHVYCAKCKPMIASCHVCQLKPTRTTKLLSTGTGFSSAGHNQTVTGTVGLIDNVNVNLTLG